MSQHRCRDVLHRYEHNPIIELEDIPFRCNTVFNAAATRYDNHTLLLLRIENQMGQSVLALARSADGYEFAVDPAPILEPAHDGPMAPYERYGVEDPRITLLDGVYYIMYTAYSDWGPAVALATTTDFRTFERRGLMSMPVTKNAALFPKKIGGRYCRFERSDGGGGTIWISYSPDLEYWGDHHIVMAPRSGHWDCTRVGAGAPPIETPQGWLEIYHGVKDTSHGPIYRLGAVLLDLEDPTVVLGRTLIPILSPRETYERVGDIGNVVFSCGAVHGHDDMLWVYYGAADTCICVATALLQDVVESCMTHDSGRLA